MTQATDVWVDTPPDTRPRRYDWEQIVAGLREHPARWTLALPDAPLSVAVAIDNRAMKALQMDDGKVEVRRRDTYTLEGTKKRYGNLWLRFVPNETEGET